METKKFYVRPTQKIKGYTQTICNNVITALYEAIQLEKQTGVKWHVCDIDNNIIKHF